MTNPSLKRTIIHNSNFQLQTKGEHLNITFALYRYLIKRDIELKNLVGSYPVTYKTFDNSSKNKKVDGINAKASYSNCFGNFIFGKTTMKCFSPVE